MQSNICMRNPDLPLFFKEENKLQYIYRFKNGYGVSLAKGPKVRGGGSAGETGWSVAVIIFNGPAMHEFELTYPPSICAGDLIFDVPDGEIDEILESVENLPEIGETALN